MLDVSMMRLTEIQPYENNPRLITDDDIEKMMSSLREYGFRQPIVVDGSYTIVAGHLRYLAAKNMGLEEVPVHIANDLSPEKVSAYRIADNKIGMDIVWDNEKLGAEFKSLYEADFDLEKTGFSKSYINDVLNNDFLQDSRDDDDISSQFMLLLEFDDESSLKKMYDEAIERGITCKIIT